MKISYRIDSSMPQSVHELVAGLVEKRFEKHSFAINSITASLIDVNGPRGGVAVRCRLVIDLKRGRNVVIQETALTIAEATSRAFDRATYAVAKKRDLAHRRRNGRLRHQRQVAFA